MPGLNVAISDRCARDVASVYGDAGTDWLRRLPEVIAACASRWSLVLEPPFPDSYVNYVAPGRTAGGAEVVLKLGVPHPDRDAERAALRVYNGRGAVLLIDSDPAVGAMLLERVTPGTTLAVLEDDDRATRIAAILMRRLWQPVPEDHCFPAVAEFMIEFPKIRQRFNGGTGPFSKDVVDKAEGLFAELLASSSDLVVLHGDLHHTNIVAGERENWLAIDPAGYVGDRGFEVGPFLHNPGWIFDAPDLPQLLRRRLQILAEVLEIDFNRLLSWGVVFAVISAWWCIEDNSSDVANPVAFAEVLAGIR